MIAERNCEMKRCCSLRRSLRPSSCDGRSPFPRVRYLGLLRGKGESSLVCAQLYHSALPQLQTLNSSTCIIAQNPNHGMIVLPEDYRLL